MKRETHDPEPHELEAAGYTEPDIRMPYDGELRWLGYCILIGWVLFVIWVLGYFAIKYIGA